MTELEFSGDLVYKYREIVDKTDFSVLLKKDCHSLQNVWLQNDFSVANCMHGLLTLFMLNKLKCHAYF